MPGVKYFSVAPDRVYLCMVYLPARTGVAVCTWICWGGGVEKGHGEHVGETLLDWGACQVAGVPQNRASGSRLFLTQMAPRGAP